MSNKHLYIKLNQHKANLLPWKKPYTLVRSVQFVESLENRWYLMKLIEYMSLRKPFLFCLGTYVAQKCDLTTAFDLDDSVPLFSGQIKDADYSAFVSQIGENDWVGLSAVMSTNPEKLEEVFEIFSREPKKETLLF